MLRHALLLVLPLLAASAAAAPSPSDARARTAARLSELYKALPEPKGDDLTENTDYMLLEALRAFALSYDAARDGGVLRLPEDAPKEWTASGGARVPVDALMEAAATVSGAYRRFGLDPADADEFAFRVMKETVEALHADWDAYERFLVPLLEKGGRSVPGGRLLSDDRLRAGLRQVLQLVEVSTDYDIPYLAGYSEKDPKRIYIDRGLQDRAAIPFLVVHEVTEKLLIDALGPQDRLYLHTHQFAQRVERECVLASGVSWHDYQEVSMQKEIKRAEDPARAYQRTPADLDLTPYLEYKDTETIAKMRAVAKAVPRAAPAGMRLETIRPGILHVYFDSGLEMAKTLLRFQETYESPEFRGKTFTLDQFVAWYTRKNGKFDYYHEWGEEEGAGFNFPETILEPFFAGRFDPLSERESRFLDLFRDRRHADLYIIATCPTSGDEIKHEMAHALFYFDPEYKKAAVAVLNAHHPGPLERRLVDHYGYDKAVAVDEANAWLLTDLDTLRQDGFDVRPYAAAARELTALYGRFYQPFDAPVRPLGTKSYNP